MNIDEKSDKLTIVSDNVSEEQLRLKGATGYNNGVLLLHNIGKKLYSCSRIGGIGRALTISDTDLVNSLYKKIREDLTWNEDTNCYYPKIYTRDWFSQIDEIFNSKGGQSGADSFCLSESEQDRYLDTTTVKSDRPGYAKANKSVIPHTIVRN